jgi:hypothetical protein
VRSPPYVKQLHARAPWPQRLGHTKSGPSKMGCRTYPDAPHPCHRPPRITHGHVAPPIFGSHTAVENRPGHVLWQKKGGALRAAPLVKVTSVYWALPLLAASAWAILAAISAFRASRLKLAPRCMGGYSKKVWISLAIICWTKTKRQN